MKHREAIIYSLVNLGGCLLPSIISFFYYLATNQLKTFSIFYQDGQFFIYSASLLTASAYVLFTWKKKNTDIFSCIFWFSAVILVISSLLYAFQTAGIFENEKFLKKGSLLIFCLTLIIYYFSNYQNSKKIDPVLMDHLAVDNLIKRM